MEASAGRLRAPDGLTLATRAWLPRPVPRAAMVLVHGLGEHIGRYQRLAGRLADAGYAVHGFDQRGHGASEGERCNVGRFEEFVHDLGAVVREVRARHPELPLVLFGHSVGGLVSLRAVQTGAVTPSVKVLSSPLLRSGMQPPKLVTSLLMALGEPFPRMPTVAIDAARLSHDADEVAAYREDPAVFHGPVKARIGAEVVRHGELALEHAGAVGVPVLLLHGREDRIADPAASVELHARLPDAAMRLVDGGKHELFHDAFAEDVTADVVRFVDRQLQPRGA